MTTHLVTKKPIHETVLQATKSWAGPGNEAMFLLERKRAFDKSSRQRVNAVNREKNLSIQTDVRKSEIFYTQVPEMKHCAEISTFEYQTYIGELRVS